MSNIESNTESNNVQEKIKVKKPRSEAQIKAFYEKCLVARNSQRMAIFEERKRTQEEIKKAKSAIKLKSKAKLLIQKLQAAELEDSDSEPGEVKEIEPGEVKSDLLEKPLDKPEPEPIPLTKTLEPIPELKQQLPNELPKFSRLAPMNVMKPTAVRNYEQFIPGMGNMFG